MELIYYLIGVMFIFLLPSLLKYFYNCMERTTAQEALYLLAKELPQDVHVFFSFDKRLLGEVIRYKKTKTEIEIYYKFPDSSGLRVRESLQGMGARSYFCIPDITKGKY